MTLLLLAGSRDGIVLTADSWTYMYRRGLENSDQRKVLPVGGRFAVATCGDEYVFDFERFPDLIADGIAGRPARDVMGPERQHPKRHERLGMSSILELLQRWSHGRALTGDLQAFATELFGYVAGTFERQRCEIPRLSSLPGGRRPFAGTTTLLVAGRSPASGYEAIATDVHYDPARVRLQDRRNWSTAQLEKKDDLVIHSFSGSRRWSESGAVRRCVGAVVDDGPRGANSIEIVAYGCIEAVGRAITHETHDPAEPAPIGGQVRCVVVDSQGSRWVPDRLTRSSRPRESAWALWHGAASLYELNQRRDARDLLTQIAEAGKPPDAQRAAFRLGSVLFETGDTARARVWFQRATDIDDRNEVGLEAQAQLRSIAQRGELRAIEPKTRVIVDSPPKRPGSLRRWRAGRSLPRRRIRVDRR